MSDHRPPDRADSEPRKDVPQPRGPALEASDLDGHRPHPSDFHADCAVGALIRAQGEPDTLKAANELQQAVVYSVLSLRDAVLEASATFKEIAHTEIAASEELSGTMKQAANAIHSAVRESRVQAA